MLQRWRDVDDNPFRRLLSIVPVFTEIFCLFEKLSLFTRHPPSFSLSPFSPSLLLAFYCLDIANHQSINVSNQCITDVNIFLWCVRVTIKFIEHISNILWHVVALLLCCCVVVVFLRCCCVVPITVSVQTGWPSWWTVWTNEQQWEGRENLKETAKCAYRLQCVCCLLPHASLVLPSSFDLCELTFFRCNNFWFYSFSPFFCGRFYSLPTATTFRIAINNSKH